MRPDPRVLLADIDQAGADVARLTGCMDGDAYAEDALTQTAVIAWWSGRGIARPEGEALSRV